MAKNPLGDNMVTTKQLADHLQVHIETVHRWRRTGIIKGTWNGRAYLFEQSDIKKLKAKLRKLSKKTRDSVK